MEHVTHSERREAYTVPELGRLTGIGPKRLRRAIASGALPAYTASSAWPRVLWSDFEAWLRSTRVPSNDHAQARVRAVLQRERAADRGSAA